MHIEHTIMFVRRETSVSFKSSPMIFLLVRAESSGITDKMADELTINELIDWASELVRSQSHVWWDALLSANLTDRAKQPRPVLLFLSR